MEKTVGDGGDHLGDGGDFLGDGGDLLGDGGDLLGDGGDLLGDGDQISHFSRRATRDADRIEIRECDQRTYGQTSEMGRC